MSGARWAAAAVSAALVAALQLVSTPPRVIPLITVQQGVTPIQVGSQTVLLTRQGNILRGFLTRSPGRGRDRVVYCPAERVFVSPDDRSLWTFDGEWVAGPAPRDLDQATVEVDADLNVSINARKVIEARGRSRGEVTGDVGDRYARFRAGDGFVRFCQDPIPPVPDAVPTPNASR